MAQNDQLNNETPFNDPDVDLWLRDGFSQLDLRDERGLEQEIDKQQQDAAAAKLAQQEEEAKNNAASELEAQFEENENDDAPTVYEYEDGASITVEKVPTGLKATLDPGNGGGKETFYGHDEGELLQQVLNAKLHATRKIRQLNRELKIGNQKPTEAQSQQAAAVVQSQVLTADEKFAFKTKFENDPTAALDEYLQRVTGKSLAQIASDAATGRAVADAYTMDGEASAFVEDHPRYVRTNENFLTILGYLAKQHLGEEATEKNSEAVMQTLFSKGFFTRASLSQAYDDLVADGLLALAEEDDDESDAEGKDAEVAQTTLSDQPSNNNQPPPPRRISRPVRPRATSIATGLRSGEVNTPPAQTESGKVPTAEEIDNMSAKEVNELLSQVTQARLRSQRH